MIFSKTQFKTQMLTLKYSQRFMNQNKVMKYRHEGINSRVSRTI